MGRERQFKGTDAEIALARFLCDITESLGLDTVKKAAGHFPHIGSRSTWAEYLNGAKRIPQPVLRDVLQELRRMRPDKWSGRLLVEANALWKAAAEGTPPPQDSSSSELVSLYRRLTETTEALYKAQSVAMNSESVIRLLLQFAGWQERRVADLAHEVEQLRERERAQAARSLDRARFRLSRVQAELERARSDRYTAEQAQTTLMREQQEIYRDFEQLQQAASDPDIEPTLLPERAPEPQMSDEEIDRRMDEQLDLIGTDREQRGVMLSEVLEQSGLDPETEEDGPRILRGTVVTEHTPAQGPAPLPARSEAVQELSRTMSDGPPTGNETFAHGPSAPSGQWRTRRKLAFGGLAIALVGAAVLVAYAVQGGDAAGPGGGDATSAAQRCLARPGSWKLKQMTEEPHDAHSVNISFTGSSVFTFHADGTGTRVDQALKTTTSYEEIEENTAPWAPIHGKQNGTIAFRYGIKEDETGLMVTFIQKKGKITQYTNGDGVDPSRSNLKLSDGFFSCADDVLTISWGGVGGRSDTYTLS
ncbi:hypothetical protein AA958_16435 [Streptomyces sp. CNQ-509]|uniref:hypothetical protein n=1 Tax=unclassified Streptomyces TaxID=2593676 RepID=UPI00062DD870|nr:hypothetical protein [Streptomyces sp. CNQ-509]AKH83531.1 hypothetical protein AA958_16435 [Streptomyces sp. CNQ-509]